MGPALRIRGLLAALVLLTAACGSDQQSVASGDEGWSTAELGAGSWTGVRTSPDGRTLVVTFVGGAPYVEDQPCTVDYRLDVTETASAVEVQVRSRRPPRPDELFCTAAGAFRRVEAELAEPLGDRPVIERQFDRTQPVFDGALLAEPRWLPDGWALQRESAGFPDPEAGPAWERTWGPPAPPPTDDGTCAPGDGPITLTQGRVGALEGLPALTRPAGTRDVGGREATVREGIDSAAGQRWLTWDDDTRSSIVGSFPGCAGEGAADLDLLVRFAEGLLAPSR